MSLTINSTQAANAKATQLMQQWNFLIKQTKELLADGQLPIGDQITFSSNDFTIALGAQNVSTLNQLIAILNP